MRAYETLFVLKPDLEKEAIEELVGKVKTVIETAGTVEKVDDWGNRKLAYEIDKKYQEGHYILVDFSAENSVLDALDHLYKITEPFIRSIVIKKEK
ncbi:30S ribosomal protein S6 [Acetobacterium fimetarium]|jgi:small subunit ribosomal protein S6|uniref:Small ribosomal subunit protein bS6 n=1 Tax=Acetobacterium fimetarium TaxID=52691 RepID=A0ABR6WWA1_9FIRM|nr:30S ribosomal protein S6 [Acetobacterium fimetarium]MBC3804860.1 30S ribosomal protein S6 [Acetobacterium fimetarium]